MSEHAQDNEKQPSTLLLTDDCSEWKASSQYMEDLYLSGVKLWRKRDLADIEKQLSQFRTLEKFTIRRVDGSIIHIENPMFGVGRPSWLPTVLFKQYWRLVYADDGEDPETYSCSYLIQWENRAALDSRGLIENSRSLFAENKRLWDNSITCDSFKPLIRKLLYGRKISNIVCFGIGDICRHPPEWWRLGHGPDWQQTEAALMASRVMQYSMILSVANEIRSITGDAVRILTQDPEYVDETTEILKENGFEVVGQFGAGGFAEVDEESIVFDAFACAPIKQVVADIARPTLFIAPADDGTFSQSDIQYKDGESPRTKQMWQEYESQDFPVAPSEEMSMVILSMLKIHARKTTESVATATPVAKDV
ncbi:hypothetical protein F4811DRAFT_564000 [Daldinia bambusicola]|nr:hypothetical protein F4811DRAFT_564000 [Daldinia bambusicola]